MPFIVREVHRQGRIAIDLNEAPGLVASVDRVAPADGPAGVRRSATHFTPRRLKRANLRELPVNAADLERIVSAAEVACAAAVSQPKDSLVRQRLYQALAPLVSPAFPGEDPELAHLHELFAQARVWADIVRTRLAGFDANRLSDPLGLAIRFPARDLLSVLTDLLRELRRARDA